MQSISLLMSFLCVRPSSFSMIIGFNLLDFLSSSSEDEDSKKPSFLIIVLRLGRSLNGVLAVIGAIEQLLHFSQHRVHDILPGQRQRFFFSCPFLHYIGGSFLGSFLFTLDELHIIQHRIHDVLPPGQLHLPCFSCPSPHDIIRSFV